MSLPLSRTAGRKTIRTVPVRMVVEVFWTAPSLVVLGDEPVVVRARGRMDLNPDVSRDTLPLWFLAEVEVHPDRTAEIISFSPAYGSIQGGIRVMKPIMYIYESAFARALVDTRLTLIGVR